jgi:hypothetical protein
MRTALPLLLVSFGAMAQTAAVPSEFPAEASTRSADELRSLFAGKVLRARLADGSTWRLEYKANGYAFVDTGTGFRDTGQWRVEDGRICVEWRKAPGGCNEARSAGSTVYIKRTQSGEVVALRE